jgi:hypothetical protein
MADQNPLQCGTRWGTLTLDNVRFTDLKESATPWAPVNSPLTVHMKNVSWTFHESANNKGLIDLHDNANTVVIEK